MNCRITAMVGVGAVALFAVSSLSCAGEGRDAPSLIDLGTLGGDLSFARAINDRGQIVGISRTESAEQRAFLWERGRMIDLGTLGGTFSIAVAINERGQIVGDSAIPLNGESGEVHAFLWDEGVMIDLGTLGGPLSRAVAINDRGQVVGISQVAAGRVHAFLWDDGTMIDLGTLGGNSSEATDINEQGQIVGSSDTASGETHAFLWEDGTMRDLGTLGGTSSQATDINDRGQITGTSDTTLSPVSDHAFLWDHGKMVDLGTLGGPGSAGRAINELGQVVGHSHTSPVESRAFLWQNGEMLALENLGVVAGSGADINDLGQVVGENHYVPFGPPRGFLWEAGVTTDLTSDTESDAFAINNLGTIIGGYRPNDANGNPGNVRAAAWTTSRPVDTVVMEAETMFLSAGYGVEPGKEQIFIADTAGNPTGYAHLSFPGGPGTYQIEVQLINGGTGLSVVEFYLNGERLGYQYFDFSTQNLKLVLPNVTMVGGDDIILAGWAEGDGGARVDKIVFVPL